MSDRKLIDATEASRLSGLAKATIYKLAHQGRLRSFGVLNRTLRFDRADVEALVRVRPVGNGAAQSQPVIPCSTAGGAR